MKKAFLSIICLLLALFVSGCIKTYTYQAERKDQDLVGNRGIIKGEIPPAVTGRQNTRTMGGMDIELPASEEYKSKKETIQAEAKKETIEKRVKRGRTGTIAAKKEIITEEPSETAVEPAAGEKEVKIKEAPIAQQWISEEKKITTPVEPEKEAEKISGAGIAEEKVSEKPKPQPIAYTVQEGDTLGKIASKFLGDESRWTDIYEANKNVIKNPSQIYPGDIITIPQDISEPEEKTEELSK